VKWTEAMQNGVQWRAFANKVMSHLEMLLNKYQLLKEGPVPWSNAEIVLCPLVCFYPPY
jgi:hypothetical protein